MADDDDGDEEGAEFAEKAEGDEVGDEGVGAELAKFRGGLHRQDKTDTEGHEAGHGERLDADADHLPQGRGRGEDAGVGQSPHDETVNPGVEGHIAISFDPAKGINDEFQEVARAFRASDSLGTIS